MTADADQARERQLIEARYHAALSFLDDLEEVKTLNNNRVAIDYALNGSYMRTKDVDSQDIEILANAVRILADAVREKQLV